MDKNKQKYKYLYLLSEKYPNRQSVVTELIRLKAILNLARPTEHFMSDLHGEYESFFHILNNCSGVIKEKVDYLFSEEMSTSQKAEFCTLIYYPKEKMSGFMIFQSHTPTFIVVPFNFIQPFASLSSLSRSAWDFLR